MRAESRAQWRETQAPPYTRAERAATTIWMGGLTRLHDIFFCAAARSRGYNMQPLPIPDNETLKIGKEFGNRGQCNPTYYTAGNLIRKLRDLEAQGHSHESIMRDNVVLTAGSCGPCRFGMYATEYRKALREAGYPGFRILQLQQTDIAEGELGSAGLEIDVPFVVAIVKAAVAADILNALGYRIRPYEVDKGATDAVLASCRELVAAALENNRSVLRALRECRRRLATVRVDRLQPKPVVCVIGEIWAMTTEGDGSYAMHRFLEDEGAEVLVQPIYNWLLYLLWEQEHDVAIRRYLRRDDSGTHGLAGKNPVRRLVVASTVRQLLLATIRVFARAAGLQQPHIPDIAAMATATNEFYDSEVRGGEAFMEVGKFMDAAQHRLAHLVVSVKPFGCLPSSGVSDGVQSLIAARCPQTAFYAVETTGDGKVSVYSRVQMMLFNAHKRARGEFDTALAAAGLDAAAARQRLGQQPRLNAPLATPEHHYTTTAANVVAALH